MGVGTVMVVVAAIAPVRDQVSSTDTKIGAVAGNTVLVVTDMV